MKTRPSSSTSSSSKKSLTDSAGLANIDSASLISSSVSIYPQRGGMSASVSGTAGNSSSRRAGNQRSDQTGGSLSTQSETNIRKSSTSMQSAAAATAGASATATTTTSAAKERKNHDRVSLRNFISRTLFSSSSSSSTSTTTKSRSNSSPTAADGKTKSKDRKVSTAITAPSFQAVMTPVASSGATAEGGKRPSLVGSTSAAAGAADGEKQCSVCYGVFPKSEFPVLNRNMRCSHVACIQCFRQYLTVQITESRVDLTCPECDAPLHPNDMQAILDDPSITLKYEQFMIRRVLASDVDTRWCPAPDCGYAVIAAGCAECPRLVCEREECGTAFCYHCAGVWHPVSTCDEARAQRFGLNISAAVGAGAVTFRRTAGNALFSAAPSSLLGKIKPCPRCRALIAKMDDGSCNHMTCTICGADFCWLCMKEISDLHFLSPTGCTFWGKKPWSRKKKLICQLGTLIGAPVGIALVAGVAIPSMIIGIPIWVGRKIHRKMIFSRPFKRNIAVVSGVTGAVLLAPAVAALVVGFGVPLMLAYVYGVVPFSLCRNGGTCRSSPNATNSVANSNSNLSSDDVIVGQSDDDPSIGGGPMHHLRNNSSTADVGSLDIVTHQHQLHGSKSPDEQLMLRMMMVLDENDVFVSGGHTGKEDGKSVTEPLSARIRHRAEINHNAASQVEQTASIGEFSMDSSDVHSQRKLVLMDPSGHSITDTDAVRLTEERDEAVAMMIRINDEEKSNFDCASTLAFHLSTRRQSASSGSVNCSLGDRLTLETMSNDLEDIGGGDSTLRDNLDVTEQDNASTKALAGSILGNRDHNRRMTETSTRSSALDLSPSSVSVPHLSAGTGRQDSVRSLDTSSEIV